jgi:hypothetical protein
VPRIFLKPNSAEFHDEKKAKKAGPRRCNMPGCPEHGEYRAPKDRALSEYYWFCLEHVREYNSAWNFFEGMSGAEVEQHIVNSMYGDRPTRRYDNEGMAADAIRRAAWQTYHFTEEEPPRGPHFTQEQKNTPEYEAMMIMGLQPPLSLAGIKSRYKELVKKYHPDVNRDDPKAEELLKSVNMAYTILKLNYEKFEELPA